LEPEPRTLGQLKEYVKRRFYEVESRGFLALERSFVLLDDTKTREISFDQFSTALNENLLDMNDAEKQVLYHSCKGDSKNLPYLKWINEMRGQMPQGRESLCSELFDVLDQRKNRTIKVDDFERRYYPEASELVKNGIRNPDELYDEMADRIDIFGRLGGYDFKSGIITYDEFMEFWDNVSSIIRDDHEFNDMLNNCYIN